MTPVGPLYFLTDLVCVHLFHYVKLPTYETDFCQFKSLHRFFRLVLILSQGPGGSTVGMTRENREVNPESVTLNRILRYVAQGKLPSLKPLSKNHSRKIVEFSLSD